MLTFENILPPDQIKQKCQRLRDSSSSSSSSSDSSSSTSSDDGANNSIAQAKFTIDEPSTSKLTNQAAGRCASKIRKKYHLSPINSNESDVDLSDSDPTYRSRSPLNRRRLSISSTSSSSSSSTHLITLGPDSANNSILERARHSRKRVRDPSTWKQNVAKSLRNSGKTYISTTTKKEVPGRCMKNACNCRLKCADNIDEFNRTQLFKSYWSLGEVELQRSYIRCCMMEVKPRYKYSNAARPRLPNNAFYFTVNNNKIRVCKTFFINTLGICDRQIRTTKMKTDPQGFLSKDNRGKHASRKAIDPLLIQYVKQHIDSIPRIESHYLRAKTSREYISGDKTVTDLWRDFDKSQRDNKKPTCDYWLYYDIFNKEFNITFFEPKKDRCNLCFEYELALSNRKIELKEKYDAHLIEKDLCRNEKRRDRQNIDDINICAVYDLQAVMQCPTGETSSFYYKSKLNCLNFTIVELLKKTDKKDKHKNNAQKDNSEIGAYGNVYSYFWDETQGKRGANEIGSCVLEYLQQLNEQNPNKALHIIFYSDNCCGQNKNKYIASLYSYAVTHFENIQSITHKYLVKGHTQNEGDNVHSIIEKEIKRNKKSGPIYSPIQYITLIKSSRKHGKPFTVKELTYDFFVDVKNLQEKWAYNFNEDEHKNTLSWNNVKVLKFCKENCFSFCYKTSYSQSEFTMVNMRNKRKKMMPAEEITTTKAFTKRLELSENKKKDLRDLVTKNLIPNYYAEFFNNIVV